MPFAFGFFFVKVTSPDELNHPILLRKVNTDQGLRSVAGLGTWEGWFFSPELENAIDWGYKVEIIRGYRFEQSYLFSGFVDKMYNLRLEYKKEHPMNLIAKLLMNSLYGTAGRYLA